MSAERLRPQDATLWCAQAPDAPLQIGALCLFEAGPLVDAVGSLLLDDLRRHVESRLNDVPRFRTRLASVPFGQGLMWVDDPDFDIAHHVRAAALPRPGGDAELREFVSRQLETPLDRRRPLWEIWVVEGIAGGRVAILPKVSHVMADGMALLEFALTLLDADPAAPADVTGPPWSPSPPPPAGRLVAAELLGRGRMAADLAGRLVGALRRPDHLVRRVAALARAAGSAASMAPALPISGPVGPHRDFGWLRLPVDDLLAVKRSHGVTLNDVVLSVVAGAVRLYLEEHGAPLDVGPRVLVPVSTHAVAGEEIENRFSMMIAELPVAEEDPVDRLCRIHVDMQRHKASSQQEIGPVLFLLGGLLPPSLLAAVGPPVLEHQPFVNLAVTDLPGTRDPMYLLGSRLLELFPFVGVTGNISLIVGALSYGDSLGIGITVDADVIPDVDRLVVGIEQAADSLVRASRARPAD